MTTIVAQAFALEVNSSANQRKNATWPFVEKMENAWSITGAIPLIALAVSVTQASAVRRTVPVRYAVAMAVEDRAERVRIDTFAQQMEPASPRASGQGAQTAATA